MKAEEQTPITPDENLIYAKIGGCLRNQESIYAVKVVSDLMEQYAELRIQQELQQEREKWKEEVIKAFREKSNTAESILETLNDMHSNDEISYDRYAYLFDKVASMQLD